MPFIIIATLYVNYKRKKFFNVISKKDSTKIEFNKVKNALSISLSSKIGTGAVIGVLAAMWKTSQNGIGGEAVVLWVIIGMILLIPLTYSEVFFTQVINKTPRNFIERYINKKVAAIYAVSLVILYSFGFTGFQMTGVQSVVKIFAKQNFNYNFTTKGRLIFIVIPIIVIVSSIVLTKSYKLFINVLGSLVSLLIILYAGFFLVFLFITRSFIPEYLSIIWRDFLNFRAVATGIPIGLIVGFQRIIQVSETGLGTSALASSDMMNSPRREAMLQTIATIITICNAIIITSYVFTYGRYNLNGVVLSGDGLDRIASYLNSAYGVTGFLGQSIIIMFFLTCGFTTVLSSYHFINTIIYFNENKRIVFYVCLVTASGILSVSNFDMIFDAVDLLMFIVATINITALCIFVYKDIQNYKIK
ncbi:alanine:cation symporter family protein [Clostridium botulinum]|uniref:alanine:cation symporter family protein n=1 Tax=Clostridium botulinum TaxID=1491 RepID=UPI0013FB01F0|nr:alanine:cation symporter family protein [Clostridium botulinum]MCJ8172032.1 alanine:cation symporter family protein [Clostridium botulinum]NFK78036.1 alanine:cation symporter family protein [Clostridium botulinum]